MIREREGERERRKGTHCFLFVLFLLYLFIFSWIMKKYSIDKEEKEKIIRPEVLLAKSCNKIEKEKKTKHR